MSFILKNQYTPFIISKLTEYGRAKLAKGQLNFKSFAFGDSEVDYNYIDSLEPNGGQVLLPKDASPTIKTFLVKTDKLKFTDFDNNTKKVVKTTVHKAAKERGFFENNTIKIPYFKDTGFVSSNLFTGTNQININTVNFENGDFIIFKDYHEPVINENNNSVERPVKWLVFKIEKTPAIMVIDVDRNLPNHLNYTVEKQIPFYILPNSGAINTFYSTNADVLWDDDNLVFKKDCLIEDTKVWNLNIVFSETLIGTKLTQFDFTEYKSFDYIGTKEYLGYNNKCEVFSGDTIDCLNKLESVKDDVYKNIGIIHYTNKNLSNSYAEFFHIDHTNNIHFKLDLPLIMWHRRYFSDSNGNLMGASFISTGDTKYVENSDIPYYDLIDNPTIIGNRIPKIIGRVYFTLKIATIHDSEILAALTYKSNRNYTLPSLKAKMFSPTNGIGTGILPKGKTCFLTYTIESDDDNQIIFPQQNYIQLINDTVIDRDIEFELEDVGLLPYMKQKEKLGYDGFGFYGHRFKLLFQIVDNGTRPQSHLWEYIDYTNNFLTILNGNTIDPLRLENQNNNLTGFILNNTITTEIFNLDYLSLTDNSCPNGLYLGEESILLGNINTEIGVNVFKSQLDLSLDEGLFEKSENPTWDISKNLWVSEMGIFDDAYKQVMIAKLFKPIEIKNQTINLFELSTDY